MRHRISKNLDLFDQVRYGPGNASKTFDALR